MAHSEANLGVLESRTGKNVGEFYGETIGSSQIEETSPDLLKNTPTNIARLEDVIEQCVGRQKYLAQTKSPSDGEDIRWYFCKVPLGENERAASVPRTEIVGKSEYFRFSMRDSLALEASFLQREEELLSGWWKEYAECSEGPSGSCMLSDVSLDMQPKRSSSEVNGSIYAIEEERVGVPVKGGLYEVDLVTRHCFPVYWHGENRRVLRGHWFARKAGLEWLPLRENVAEQLEFAFRCKVWHRRTFQPSGLFAARIDLQGTTQGLHALFTGEDDTWEAWLDVDTSGFPVIGLRGNGITLRRGFSSSGSLKPTQDELRQQNEEEMDDYCSQVPVRHLVFMVHGIGQRLEKANLVDDVGNFRHITASLAERHLTSFQRDTQRVLFIPCQWRRGLKLGGETAVEKITLDGVRGLRVMLSATVHDVLYYMSPIYCQEIIDSVSNQLNRLYMKFIKRNPGYDGKVSIYGHSLGSVLSFDILCHQESLSSPFPIESMNKGFVEVEESPVVVDQSPQSIPASDIVSPSANRNGETSEELASLLEGLNSSSKTNVVVHEENPGDIYATLNPSPTSDTEVGSSKTNCNPSPVEETFLSFQHITDVKQSSDISLFKEDGRKPDQDPADMFSQDGKDLCANQNVREVPDGDVDSVVDDRYEKLSDEDELITLLREEVKSLKARIAELEIHNNSSQEFHRDDKVGEGTPNVFYSRKLSPDQDDLKKSCTPFVNYTKLDFKVDTFFAVGSPLGFFLALRNIRIGIGRGQDYWQDERIREEMPSCRQMLNIFHPFDPVAYRLEPLICKDFVSRRPVIIPYHRGGKRLHIGFQEFTEDLAARSQSVMSHLKSIRVKMVNVFQSRMKGIKEAVEDAKVEEERTYGSIMMQRLTGSEDGRIDHVLQDKTFEHSYISAIGSHTNYWRDYDTALFILKHLYRDIPEEPNTIEESKSARDSKIQRRPTGPYQNESMDEELPLTFSESSLLRDFSRKARRTLETP